MKYYFLETLRLGNPATRHQQIWSPEQLLAPRCHLLASSSHGGRMKKGGALSFHPFFENTNHSLAESLLKLSVSIALEFIFQKEIQRDTNTLTLAHII